MILLSILTAFAALRFLVILANLITRQWLRPHEVNGNPSVSILIPARNEEKNIGNLLQDLVETDNYPSLRIAEIIVYDDLSTDGTVKEVRKVMNVQNAGATLRSPNNNVNTGIRLIEGGALPEGWLGKNHACHRLAEEASGDWLLFLDADVIISPTLIRDAIGYAQKKKLRLLSLFPQQIMKTPGEWMVVPLMNWILVSLLPLVLVRTCRWTSFAAANGQFMLFDAAIYRRFQWHARVKSDPVEDIRISRLMKMKGFRTATILSAGQIQCRMYENYQQAMKGFSKNIGQFFGNSLPWMLLFTLLTTFLPFFLILSLCLEPCALSLLPFASCLYLLLIVCIRIGFSILSRQNLLKNLVYWLPQQFSLMVLVWQSVRFRSGHKIDWKGRQV